MKSYPTLYEGTWFRSRLEARFAAWFDLLGWPWDYEPFDLDGWIPDFRTGGLLWEVKPTPDECVVARTKIDRSRAPLPVVISCGPFIPPDRVPGVIYLGDSCRNQPLGDGTFCATEMEANDFRGYAWHALGNPTVSYVSAWREAGNRTQWKPVKKPKPQARRAKSWAGIRAATPFELQPRTLPHERKCAICGAPYGECDSTGGGTFKCPDL